MYPFLQKIWSWWFFKNGRIDSKIATGRLFLLWCILFRANAQLHMHQETFLVGKNLYCDILSVETLHTKWFIWLAHFWYFAVYKTIVCFYTFNLCVSKTDFFPAKLFPSARTFSFTNTFNFCSPVPICFEHERWIQYFAFKSPSPVYWMSHTTGCSTVNTKLLNSLYTFIIPLEPWKFWVQFLSLIYTWSLITLY